MLTRKVLKSNRIAEKAIILITENAQTFNREKLPVKIKEIGLGGSVLRTKNPRDIDIIVRAEFENNLNQNPDVIEYLKGVIREKLSRGIEGLNPDFHIITSNSFSDRWIPGLPFWSSGKGYVEISPEDLERFYKDEFRELSEIVEKIEKQDENLPPFFRHSIRLLKSHDLNVDTEFRDYLRRELKEMIRLRESREIPLDKLNTLLRTKMKEFGLTGLIHKEVRRRGFKEHDGQFLKKFAKYGFSYKETKSILDSVHPDS